MKKTLRILFTLILTVIILHSMNAQKHILFIGHDPLAEFRGDQAIQDSITAMGYTLDFVTSDAFSSYTTAASYDAYDAIVISESVGSSSVVPFADAMYPIPCLSLEGFAPRRWEIITDELDVQIGSADRTEDDLIVKILDNTHYITEEYEIGDEFYWSTNTAMVSVIGPIGLDLSLNIPTAMDLATLKHTYFASFPVLWALEEYSTPFIARTVVFSAPVTNGLYASDVYYATEDCYNIIKRSLRWVLDDTEGNTNIEIHSSNVVLSPNPVQDIARFNFSISHATDVTLSIYDILGKELLSVTKNIQMEDNSIELSTNELPAGVYIYECLMDGVIYTGKMQIME